MTSIQRGGGRAQGLGGSQALIVLNTIFFDDQQGCLEGVMTDGYPGPPLDTLKNACPCSQRRGLI